MNQISPSSKNTLAAICIILIIFLAFWPSLSNGFVNWDDDVHLLKNPFVHAFNVEDIFTSTVNYTYIPLTTLTFALEYHFFGENPFVYHLNNLLLHILVCLCLYFFCVRCGLNSKSSVLATLIFGLHPMHVESIAWVTERKDVLYAFFYILALLSYTGFLNDKRGSKRGLIYIIIFGLCSVLAKPMALSLPLVLFVCDWYLKRKLSLMSLIEKAIIALCLFPFAWITYVLQMRPVEFRLPESILIWIWSFVFYIKKFILLGDYIPLYSLPRPISLTHPDYFFAVTVFVLLIIALIVFRRSRTFLFAVFFYFSSIFFLLRFDWVADTNVVADRFMYLPSLGFCIALGTVGGYVLNKFKGLRLAKPVLSVAVIFIISFLFIKTQQQCRVWQNGVTLFSHQKLVAPQSARALVNNKLAEAKLMDPTFNAADAQEVHLLLSEAIRIKSDYGHAYYNFGELFLYWEDSDTALEHFLKAARLDPKNFDAFYKIGKVYQDKGDLARAARAYRQAVSINPENEELNLRIFNAFKNGRPAEGYPDVFRREINAVFKQ